MLSWLDGSGKVEPLAPAPGNYLTPRLSPDGTKLALAVVREGKQDLWVYGIRTDTWTRLTQGAEPVLLPTWTPDGAYLAFRAGNSLAWTRSDGSGAVEHVAGVSRDAGPWTFSADGNWLSFWPLQPFSSLWTVPVEHGSGGAPPRFGEPRRLRDNTAGAKGPPALSPDGKWLAYTSNDSGSFNVYVVPFSAGEPGVGGRKWTVSNKGGWAPAWSREGRRLFFQDGRRVQVVDYAVQGGLFVPEKPRIWSEARLGDTGFLHGLDVAPDGKRVLALLPAADDPRAGTMLRVLLNLDAELPVRFLDQRR